MPNYFTELKDGPSGPSFKVKDEEAEQAIDAIETALGNKVDKEAGKGLSTNDYSDTEKGKVTANAEAIEAMVNVNGCCNILPPNYDQSIGNISYTLNSDKSAIVTANVPDAEGNYALLRVASVTLKAGSYVLSGCPSGGSNSTYCLLLASPGLDNRFDIGEDLEFTATEGQEFIIWIYVGRGLSWTKTFYPMLYDARLNPTGYVPYAMTNRELTERVVSKNVTVTPASGYDLTFNHLKIVDNILYGDVALFSTNGDLPTRTWVTIASTDVRPTYDISTSLHSVAEGLSGGLMYLDTSGNIQVFQAYYDPSGVATKKGASGVFSHPL